jgi:hypothetical protein
LDLDLPVFGRIHLIDAINQKQPRGIELPIPTAQRHYRPVICPAALLRYLPEALRVQLGHCGNWSPQPLTAAMRNLADGHLSTNESRIQYSSDSGHLQPRWAPNAKVTAY